ncbi:uncharacterized protein [Diadema antillarum]|uniref:uncharacterized protein n=1 Tax=Diadema antillarum TaxID=105358 RepID=UPI003A8BB334
MTMKKNAFGISDHILITDNRGMKDFGGKYMREVNVQLAGLRKDGAEIIWDRHFFRKIILALESARKADEKFQVHCAVIVLSAKDAGFQPSVLRELVDTIKDMTGRPPVVVVTHKNSVANPSALETLKVSLVDNKIEYVHVLENYTVKDHVFDVNKHLELLEALKQCLVVADRVMCHIEEKGRCVIL